MTAAAQAIAAQQLMQDRDGDGVPDALEALQHAQAHQQRREEANRRVQRLQSQLRAAEAARMPRVGHYVAGGLGIGCVLGVGWAFVTTAAMATDPWLGVHADLFCPVTCKGCDGPYVFHRTRGAAPGDPFHGPFRIYCRHSESTVGTDWSTMMSDLEDNARYEVDFGWTGMFLCSIATWFLPGIAIVFLFAWRSVAAKKRSLGNLRQQLYHAEQICQTMESR